jgi:hypothetical protein
MRSAAIKEILETLRNRTDDLSSEEQEMLRDELLSMMLFSEFSAGEKPIENNLDGLSEEEKELIRKLARDTETLYRIWKDQQEP